MYPVDIRYRPLKTADEEADDEEELEDAIVDTAEDLWRDGPGDILVFLPGEREIRETADLLRKGLARRPYASRSRSCRSTRGFRCRSSSACSRRPRAAHRARHQRRRDLAHGAGHPLRDRRRRRARQALLAAQQDDAAADREDLAGGGEPARRALRARRRRHLRAPLRRGRFRGAPAVHGARDPAELARRGDPADGGAFARRRRRRFRFSSRRVRARSPTATSCCRSWARSTPNDG